MEQIVQVRSEINFLCMITKDYERTRECHISTIAFRFKAFRIPATP
jgi:hypothetical protein